MKAIEQQLAASSLTVATLQPSIIDIRQTQSTPCPRKIEATIIFNITPPSVEIFLQFLNHLVYD